MVDQRNHVPARTVRAFPASSLDPFADIATIARHDLSYMPRLPAVSPASTDDHVSRAHGRFAARRLDVVHHPCDRYTASTRGHPRNDNTVAGDWRDPLTPSLLVAIPIA